MSCVWLSSLCVRDMSFRVKISPHVLCVKPRYTLCKNVMCLHGVNVTSVFGNRMNRNVHMSNICVIERQGLLYCIWTCSVLWETQSVWCMCDLKYVPSGWWTGLGNYALFNHLLSKNKPCHLLSPKQVTTLFISIFISWAREKVRRFVRLNNIRGCGLSTNREPWPFCSVSRVTVCMGGNYVWRNRRVW